MGRRYELTTPLCALGRLLQAGKGRNTAVVLCLSGWGARQTVRMRSFIMGVVKGVVTDRAAPRPRV